MRVRLETCALAENGEVDTNPPDDTRRRRHPARSTPSAPSTPKTLSAAGCAMAPGAQDVKRVRCERDVRRRHHPIERTPHQET